MMRGSMNTGFTASEGATLCAPSRRPRVASLKRVFELWAMDRSFHDAFLADPANALAETGLDVDLRSATLLLLRTLPASNGGGDDADVLPEAFAWYQEYVENRFRRNMESRERDLPDDARFRDWCLRQIRRCDREIGYNARLMMHYPVAFELSSGCSMRCPFCALSVGKLKGVFRYTEDNAALWKDVIARLHRIVGDAASRALCYYATEPLDNPDYERFLADFRDEFGWVPQTTTAAATRDIERTRNLLRWGQEANERFDRLSVLSRKDLDELLAAFSPTELIFTDLLPQFEGAPLCNLTKAGRNRDADKGIGGTIACESGFVVNMWERSVRLVTPILASDEHPTGELVYEQGAFTDGASLEELVLGMMNRHMHKTIGLANLFSAGW